MADLMAATVELGPSCPRCGEGRVEMRRPGREPILWMGRCDSCGQDFTIVAAHINEVLN